MTTFREIFLGIFSFAEVQAEVYFALAVAFPVLGTVVAWMGRGGRRWCLLAFAFPFLSFLTHHPHHGGHRRHQLEPEARRHTA